MAVSTAIPNSAVARVIGIKTIFQDLRGGNILFLPQRIAIVAQGNTLSSYSLDPQQILSRKEAGDLYGYGSPIERIANELFPVNGDGVGVVPVTVYPLEDAGGGVAADGTIDAAGVQTATKTYTVKVNEIETAQFAIEEDDTADVALGKVKTAIEGVLEMPIIPGVVAAGSLPFDAKWAGETGNDIFIEIEGEAAGITFTITQAASGAANPDVDGALNKIGDVWETMLISGFNYDDDSTLDKYEAWSEGRWGALTKKPAVVFTGTNEATLATLTAVTDLRTADRGNVILPAPGSNELPFVIAARAVSRAAVVANDNPPQDYAGRKLSTLVPGGYGDQWNYTERNDAVSKGLSTTEVIDDVIELSDTITVYHPNGEVPPAYRYVVDIVKLQNIIFNTALIFEADDWKGAPLLSDETPTANPTAKKPKDAKAAIATLIDQLALNAIIDKPEEAKESIVAVINDQNPKRLDVTYTVKLSGNTNIISIDLNFGFSFGTLTA